MRRRILIGVLVLAVAAAAIAFAAWAGLAPVPLDGCNVLTPAGSASVGC